MKTRSVFACLLAMIVSLALFAFAACNDPEEEGSGTPTEQTQLTIDSETEVTIDIGQSYTLEYTCSGVVTVTVSGGNYDEATQKFTATEAGSYTITVKGLETGKKETVKTVSVTVITAADKTAIREALAKLDGLISSDYTSSSWTVLNSAKAAAEQKLEAQGVTQAEADAAAKAVEEKLAALVPAEFDKAETTESSFTWNGTTYSADDFENFAAALAKVKALDTDASAKLRSAYTKKIDEIIDSLVEKLWLSIEGLPDGVRLLAEELGTYKLTAQSDAGAAFEWKLDGTQTATTAEYDFTPAAFDTEYTISCTASKDGRSATKSLTVSFKQADYAVNDAFASGIAVENNVIKVNEFYGWTDREGKKVTFPDLYLAGDFSVYFDVKLIENGSGSAHTMALFLLDTQGNSLQKWVAVMQQSNELEVKYGASADLTIRKTMPGGSAIEPGTLLHVCLRRTVKDGKAYLTADLLDDQGNVLMTNDGNGLSYDHTGAVMLGVQTEELKVEISNLAVNADADCFGKAPLSEALAGVQDGYLESDYTEGTWTAFTSAKEGARQELENSNSTSASVKSALEALRAATAGLELAPVQKLEVNAQSETFRYRETDYSKDAYENWADIVGEIVALNEETEGMKISEYEARLAEIVARLEPNFEEAVLTGESGNIILETLEETYTYTANHVTGATYTWKVNDAVQDGETGNTFEFRPEAFDTDYEIEVTVSRGERTSSASHTVHFTAADLVVANSQSSVEGNEVKIGTGIKWDDHEGRNFVLEQLVFNGSFSISMDIVWDAWKSDNHSEAHVITFHLLKAEEYNYYNNSDKPTFHCYGALLLQDDPENGQRLEVNSGENKMKFGNEHNIRFEVGDTISVKLTAEKGTNYKYYMTFSVKDPNSGNWIDYKLTSGSYWESEEVLGGVMVGVNVENLGATLKNFRYELLSDGEHQNGSVLSKLAFQKALEQYKEAYEGYAQYTNGAEFLKAYQDALRAYKDNTDSADHAKALEDLKTAYGKIGEKQNITVSVPGLDHGANKIRAAALEADFGGEEATEISWTWGDGQTEQGKTLTLEPGEYKGLTLKFTAGGQTYTFKYQDLTVEELGLNPKDPAVQVEGGKVTVTNGMSWSNNMLDFTTLSVRDFEFAFDIKKLAGHEDAENIVAAIRTNDKSEAMTAVIGFKRNGGNGGMQIGFNGDNNYTEPFDQAVRDALWNDGAHIVLRQVLRTDYTAVQTLSIYKTDGTLVASRTSAEYRLHRYSSATNLEFSFENIDCELTNIRLSYFD